MTGMNAHAQTTTVPQNASSERPGKKHPGIVCEGGEDWSVIVVLVVMFTVVPLWHFANGQAAKIKINSVRGGFTFSGVAILSFSLVTLVAGETELKFLYGFDCVSPGQYCETDIYPLAACKVACNQQATFSQCRGITWEHPLTNALTGVCYLWYDNGSSPTTNCPGGTDGQGGVRERLGERVRERLGARLRARWGELLRAGARGERVREASMYASARVARASV